MDESQTPYESYKELSKLAEQLEKTVQYTKLCEFTELLKKIDAKLDKALFYLESTGCRPL